MIPIEKINSMLEYYRKRLEKVNEPPVDYVEGIRVSAKISVLEDLFYYAHNHASHPAPDRSEQGQTADEPRR